jgi:hypothetical protein
MNTDKYYHRDRWSANENNRTDPENINTNLWQKKEDGSTYLIYIENKILLITIKKNWQNS